MIISFLLSLAPALIYGVIAARMFEFVMMKNTTLRKRYYHHHQIFFGYHFHHSMYGVACFVLAAAFPHQAVFFIPFGIGIILQHTWFEKRFVFIERQRHA